MTEGDVRLLVTIVIPHQVCQNYYSERVKDVSSYADRLVAISTFNPHAKLLLNILNQVLRELNRLTKHRENDSALAALAARNIFELRVQLEKIKQDQEIRLLMGERCKDEFDFHEGAMYLFKRIYEKIEEVHDVPPEAKEVSLQRLEKAKEMVGTLRLTRLRELKDVHNVEVVDKSTAKNPQKGGKDAMYVWTIRKMDDLTKGTPFREDYQGAFTFLSKHVHPTPWIVHGEFSSDTFDSHFSWYFKMLMIFLDDLLEETKTYLETGK